MPLKRTLILSGLILTFFTFSCQKHDKQVQNGKLRIISLAPHITEIIYALHAQDELVAVTDFCKFPPEARNKEKIGGLLDPNIEKMIALKPTHLFGLPSHAKLSEQLSSFGYRVTMLPDEEVKDILQSILFIGDQIGRHQTAQQLIDHIRKTLDSLRVSADDANRLPGVLLIGRTKGTLQNMTAAGEQTYLNELWRLVGGRNIYADLPTRYGSVNLESLLLRNPAVIIEFDMQKPHSLEKEKLGPEWQLLKNTPAVKNGQVYIVGGSHTMIPGPRVTWLARDFQRIIDRVKNEERSHH